ncbi:MAG: peptidylprolyl isomerase [Oscillospiraceae bacterium]|nr:peptidylprolyl isomerase [Oscillospiraceae bacterium]
MNEFENNQVEQTEPLETPVEEVPVEETPVEETPVEETPVEEVPVEETPVVEAPVVETPAQEAPKKKAPVMWIVIVAILVVALAVAVAFAIGRAGDVVDDTTTTEVELFDPALAHHTNAHGYASWSVHYHTEEGDTNLHYYYLDENAQEITLTADEVNTMMNQQIATCGDMTLDNRTLQYYYSNALMAFQNSYYNYLAYMMDTSAPLDAQLNNSLGDGSATWQKYFLDNSLENFKTVAAMAQEAEKNGFTMSEDDQAYLDSMLDLDTMAMMYGIPDAVTLVKQLLGPMATVESYTEQTKTEFLAQAYLQSLYEQIEVTDEEIGAYYDANADVYAQQNIQKIDENVMNVRHILIQPEAAEDGTISEEAWAAAETEAQRILDEWKAGEATESTFGDLAEEYSTDPGSNTMGGLYEEVYPGQMVTEFNDWCFDDARQTGDTGIVKTSYGYHIMYYVAQGDYVYWQKTCEDALLSEKLMEIREEVLEGYETTVDTTKIIMLEVTEATKPAETTEAVIIPAE